MKKEYQAPKMELVDFDLKNTILCGSSEPECDDGDYCDELGFNAGGVTNHKA